MPSGEDLMSIRSVMKSCFSAAELRLNQFWKSTCGITRTGIGPWIWSRCKKSMYCCLIWGLCADMKYWR